MVAEKEAVETLSRCPDCRREPDDEADPKCATCDGVGIVSGRVYVEWQSEMRTRITRH